jgi:asparagine synthase (glutamine-hydrolysing)
MHRFVAMTWNPASPDAARRVDIWSDALRRAPGDWTCALDTEGARVLIPAGQVLTTVSNGVDVSGIIIGRLFERWYERQGRVSSLAGQAASGIARSNGANLIRAYWGQYVAIWRCARSRETVILRDPSGAVGCSELTCDGVRLFFAHAPDVVGLTGIRVSFNWDRISAFLDQPYLTTVSTGLNEITDLLAGERLTLDGSGASSRAWAWNAKTFAAEPDLRPVADLQADVRETVSNCVRAIGEQHKSILVQLSGGLDSSVLLALLRRSSPANVCALHTQASGHEGFESDLARMVAANTGTSLVVRKLAPERVDLSTILDIPVLVRPDRQIMGKPGNDLIADVCDETGADATLAGHGGDSLFLQRSAATNTVTDYLQLHGWTREAWSVVYRAAMLEERPIWTILREATRKSRRDAPTEKQVSLHPWLDDAASLPPGKRDQLVNIVALYNYYVLIGYGVSRDALNPYVSQPIIELALTIPTYQFVREGHDRSLQRRAFSGIVPSPIIRRKGKGFLNTYLLKVIEHNARFLRELLHEGWLTRSGLIEREAIDPMFTPAELVSGAGLSTVSGLVAAEAWINAWRRTGVVT